MLIKAAILLEWTHILVPRGTSDSYFYWGCHIMIVVNSMFFMSTIVAINLICTPRDKIWRDWVDGSCFDYNGFNISIAAINFAFNIIILLLPHWSIWKLALSTRQKIGVSIIFSVGIMYVL